MAEHDQLPRVYESLNPTERFVALAQEILNQYGFRQPTESENSTVIGTGWPDGQSGQYYELQRRSWQGTSSSLRFEYVLAHHREPGGTPLRYRVRNNGPIRVLDADNSGKTLDPITDRIVRQEALTILSAKAPEKAAELMDSFFDYRFRDLTGKLVLSHLAVTDGEAIKLTDKAVTDAIAKHALWVVKAQDLALTESRLPSNRMDPANVQQAINHPKLNGEKINMIDQTKLVAKAIGPYWQNTLPPDVDSQHHDAMAKYFEK
jgi:hypothetical protein